MFRSVSSYYKVHSRIYDLTRWTILFSRDRILEEIRELPESAQILDLGCGTGKHFQALTDQFPSVNITGIDVSPEMLNEASKKIKSKDHIELINSDWRGYLPKKNLFDLIICSYSLSMMQDLEACLARCKESLKDSGVIVVIDFDSTPLTIFRKWMNLNHVDISGKLFRMLNSIFLKRSEATKLAYLGLWKYTFFVGSK